MEDETTNLPATSTAPGAVTAPSDEYDAFGELRGDEAVLPTVKLVQGVSRDADSKRSGEFYNTVTEEYKPGLRVALLAMKRSRSFFGDSFDDPPLCASDDAVVPRETVEIERGDGLSMTTGPSCDVCPLSQWGSKGKGQACRLSYNLLCYDLEDESFYIMRVAGTSIFPFRKYFSAGKMGKLPAYAIETRIGSREETFDAGQAYALTFASGDPLPPDVADLARQHAASFRDVSLGTEGEDRTAEPDDFPTDDAPEDVPFE